jgi:hypothetical protein
MDLLPGPTTLILSERTLYALEKYTQVKVEAESVGNGSENTWEHARSYAAEAVVSLLIDNPTMFRYDREMRKIMADRKRS